ncbi:MAG: hypothetical protein QW478_08840 [Candidatus Micrarchaeaceae archaeon]
MAKTTKTINGNLRLKEDTVFDENIVVNGDIIGTDTNLTVHGNITAKNINLRLDSNLYAYNIRANNITAVSIETLYDIISTGTVKATYGDIEAINITAKNILAQRVFATTIKAEELLSAYDILADGTISANKIDYYGVCIAYEKLTYNTIHHARPKAIHLALDDLPSDKNTNTSRHAKESDII